jgi:hypothetical protein
VKEEVGSSGNMSLSKKVVLEHLAFEADAIMVGSRFWVVPSRRVPIKVRVINAGAINTGAVKAGSGSYHRGGCRKGGFWVVLSRPSSVRSGFASSGLAPYLVGGFDLGLLHAMQAGLGLVSRLVG